MVDQANQNILYLWYENYIDKMVIKFLLYIFIVYIRVCCCKLSYLIKFYLASKSTVFQLRSLIYCLTSEFFSRDIVFQAPIDWRPTKSLRVPESIWNLHRNSPDLEILIIARFHSCFLNMLQLCTPHPDCIIFSIIIIIKCI